MAELIKSYRGVSCVRCRDPIPVSAKVSPPQETEHGKSTTPLTFIVRCKLCESESVYAVSDIQIFAGMPRQRTFRARAAGA